MGMKLFDDDDEVERISEIKVDKEFAKRYEHNKKREDLHRYEEMKKKGQINGSDSESESDTESDSVGDDDAIDGKEKIQLLDVLLKIRKKDPVLKQKDAKLFESSDDDDDDDDGDDDDEVEEAGGDVNGGERKSKPKYLKDVMGKTLMVDGPEFEDDDDDDEIDGIGKVKAKSYVEEQDDLRNEVLAAMAAEEERGNGGASDEEGGLLREKKRGGGDEENEVGDEELKAKLDEFFGDDDELDENNKFLKEFIMKDMWDGKKNGKGKESLVDEDGEMIEFSDDEEAIEKQEEFERDFNFRFEEGKSDRVLGHSRFVEGSVRKEADGYRKRHREKKKEKLEIAEMERRVEVKRLKNLKRKELLEKLSKIKEVAGVEGEGIELDEEDLEGDFDPEEYDKKMKNAFGDGYYEAEDVDPEFGNESEGEGDLEKPNFDKEDELLGLPKDWDVIKSNEGFMAKRAQRKKSQVEGEPMEEVDDGDEQPVEGKRKKRRKSKLREALTKDLEEELYKLDYEDAIGDLKTRFKYRQVKPDRFKLSAAEILWLEEQELNQYVSLKKIAPYRDFDWKVPQMRKQMLLGGLLNGQKKQKKRRMDGEGPSEPTSKTTKDDPKSQEEQPNHVESKLSRSARRRRNQKEKKLPQSRLIAYGKIPASSTKNSKS